MGEVKKQFEVIGDFILSGAPIENIFEFKNTDLPPVREIELPNGSIHAGPYVTIPGQRLILDDALLSITDGNTVDLSLALDKIDINVVSTDTIQFADDSEMTSITVSGVTGSQAVDTFSTTSFKSAKYVLQATSSNSITCSEVLLLVVGDDVQISHYGVLGDSALIDVTASISNNQVSLIIDTDSTINVTLMRFAIS